MLHGIIDLRDLFQLVIFFGIFWWTGISTSLDFFQSKFSDIFKFSSL